MAMELAGMTIDELESLRDMVEDTAAVQIRMWREARPGSEHRRRVTAKLRETTTLLDAIFDEIERRDVDRG